MATPTRTLPTEGGWLSPGSALTSTGSGFNLASGIGDRDLVSTCLAGHDGARNCYDARGEAAESGFWFLSGTGFQLVVLFKKQFAEPAFPEGPSPGAPTSPAGERH